MVKLNCPHCKRRRKFFKNEEEKFVCRNCNYSFKQCNVKDCSNLISYGFVCKECIGKGYKKGGSAAIGALAIVGGIAYKMWRK